MDELGSRASTAGRRMATARTTTVRRGSGASVRSAAAAPEIPPARWAGVALVIAALLGTIVLAVISPGGDGSDDRAPGLVGDQVEATAPPAAATAVPGGDARVPTARPRIRQPRDGTLESELEISLTVEVPQEALASRHLSLLILRDGEEIERLEHPERGRAVQVGGVRLTPGPNELTAVLEGPGGSGPTSDPVVVHLDGDAPPLRILAPEAGTETYEDHIDLTIASEPGAILRVRNQANKRDSRETVGPSGEAQLSVRLDTGRNRILVTSTDEAGHRQDETVTVQRIDARPRIALTLPKELRRSSLPRRITVGVGVKDGQGEPIPDATVTYSLSGSGWPTQNFEDTTNANGRSEWRLELGASASKEPIKVAVEVVTEHDSESTFKEIEVS